MDIFKIEILKAAINGNIHPNNCCEGNYTFKLKNISEQNIFDISIFVFNLSSRLSRSTNCIKKIPLIAPNSEIEFSFEAKPLTNYYSRIFFRLENYNKHCYINVYPNINKSTTYQNIDSFIALLKLKSLKKIINIIPYTIGVSYNSFGILLDTSVNILYQNYSDITIDHKLSSVTLLKGVESISFKNISYGVYSTTAFGDSLLLEIPIIINFL